MRETVAVGGPSYSQVRNRNRANTIRALLAEARARPCADCGLVEPAIMDLDHVPERGRKVKQISLVYSWSLGRFREELAKCDTVCPNCHRRRTNKRKEPK